MRINGAVFQEDWDDFQYSFLGTNGLTEIRNAGQARIKGIEADILWRVTDAFTLSSAFSILDAKSTQDYCGTTYDAGPNEGEIVTDCDDPLAPVGTFLQAPAGQELPVQPKFKANAVGRYEFPMAGMDSHLQVAWVYSGSAWSDLRTDERELLGKQPSYDIVDFAFGVEKESWGLELFVKNVFDERAVLSRFTRVFGVQAVRSGQMNRRRTTVPLCGLQPYTVTTNPRTDRAHVLEEILMNAPGQGRPPFPPFTRETAAQKARAAEDAWNSRDPERVSLAYTRGQRVAQSRGVLLRPARHRRVPRAQMGEGARLPPHQGGLGVRRRAHRSAIRL